MGASLQVPMRADHRMILKIIDLVLSDADPRLDDVNRIARVFCKAGGSWERLFNGSPRDVALLKKLVRIAHKKKLVQLKSKWGS